MPTDLKWSGKWIKDLSDDELWAAIQAVADMENFRFDKSGDARLKKPKHRLNKIFNGQLPPENETFKNLSIALNDEWNKRNEPQN